MVTQEEAEQMAGELIAGYITSCKCKTQEDMSNVLMKLVSLSGLMMAGATGTHDAVERLLGTAAYVQKKGDHVRLEVVKKH